MNESFPRFTPEVSVIVPVYNGADYVREAIDSVLSQQGVAFELIVGDNASTDKTLDILREFSDPRVRVLTSERNLGIYGNLGKLFAEAKAPLVKILCADDYILPGGLARQVRLMQDRPHLAFSRCWGEGDEIRYRKHRSMRFELGLPNELRPPAGALAFATYGCLTGNLSRAIVRPALILPDMWFDLTLPYAGDFEFWSRLSSRYPFGLQNEELVYVREHPNQSTYTLNRNNELSRQTDVVLVRLASFVPPEYLNTLRFHWSTTFISQQWHKGVRRLLAGSLLGFRAAMVSRPYLYPAWISFLLYIFSLNGRVGTRRTFLKLDQVIKHLNSA